MYGQPWYSAYPSYPANAGFNPFIHPAYTWSSPYDAPRRGPTSSSTPGARALQEERAQALAERRARRARYLPDEDDEMEDYDFWPNQWPRRSELADRAREEELQQLRQDEELRRQEEELRQRQLEQLRLRKEEEARRRQEEMKRLQEEAARKHLEDEKRRQAALEQQQRRREELARRYMEEQEARQRMIEEQKNLVRLRREEEARRLAAAEEERRSRLAEQQRRAASRSRSRGPAAASDDHSVPIHFHRSTSPQSKTQNVPRAASPAPVSPKSIHTLEEKNEAASRIQKQYRIHRTYRKLEDIRTQFNELKGGFVFPHVIDFEKPGSEDGVLSVGAYRVPSDLDKEEDGEPMDVDVAPEGKLAYTSTNYALHLYSDQLDKLLIKLDGIESYGEKGIREQRRAAVKAIERETSKLDRYCKQTWMDYVEKQRQGAAASTPAPVQEAAPEPTTQVTNDAIEEAPVVESADSEITDSSLPDDLSRETVSYPVPIETDSNPPSADEPPTPSAPQHLEEPADAAEHVEATTSPGVQAEPEQAEATQIPAELTEP